MRTNHVVCAAHHDRRLQDDFEARGLRAVFNASIDLILAEHDVVQPDR